MFHIYTKVISVIYEKECVMDDKTIEYIRDSYISDEIELCIETNITPTNECARVSQELSDHFNTALLIPP